MSQAEAKNSSTAGASLAHVHLRFFDRHLRLGATDRADLAAIAALYRRFQARADDRPPLAALAPSATDWSEVIFSRVASSPSAASLRVDNRLGSLAGVENIPPSLVFEWSIASTLMQVQSHVLFHAGAVAARGQGILVVGDSGHGKTTLVLALLRRGFRFLSDDVGAIERTTGRLAPFPRSLLLRPGTLQRTGFTLLQDPPWLGAKQFVDIEDVLPDSLGEPAPLRWIVFLHNPAVAAAPPAVDDADARGYVDLWLSRIQQSVVREIARCASHAQVTVQPELPVVRLSPAPHVTILDRIERVCQSQGIFVLDIVKRAPQWPNFDAPVALERLDQGAALLHLLPHFLGSHRSPLVGSPGDVARFATLLGRLIRPAACFRLTVGDLDDMIEAVAGLVEGS
jgi:hypothetical protein